MHDDADGPPLSDTDLARMFATPAQSPDDLPIPARLLLHIAEAVDAEITLRLGEHERRHHGV
jgi:hypothetical protein